MASLLFNFFKRAIVVPVVVTAIVIGIIYAFAPKFINEEKNRVPASNETVNLSEYDVKDYNNFDELKHGGYIGKISCKSVDIGELPVVYARQTKKAVYAIESSSEPWNGGGMLIIGYDTFEQFAKLYNSEKGDKVTLEFYSKDTYNYKIESKVTGVRENELKNFIEEDKLILAVPYNDFSNLGNSYFYTLYVARKA